MKEVFSLTLQEAMDVRRSRRKYFATPIEPGIIEKLEALAQEYSQASGCRIEFVWNDGGAWNGLRKSYGMFSGVQNYAGLICRKDDFAAMERLGYYGELLMLHAVSMGLGTCWVGGSFSRKLCPIKLSGDETVICTIAVGYTPEQNSAKENLIHKVTHRKSKTAEEMMTANGTVPDWFMDGMKAVTTAPSGVNRQTVKFFYEDGKVTAGVENDKDVSSALDLGIAKLHFELGSGVGKWSFGNHAEFSGKE